MSTQEWSLDWIKMDEKPETEAEHSFDENSLVG
jgi:hypothetical protein